MPDLSRLDSDRHWDGLMPFSLDGLPFIGAAAPEKGLFVITGLASHGFMRGPEAGRMLGEFIATGKAPHPQWATMGLAGRDGMPPAVASAHVSI